MDIRRKGFCKVLLKITPYRVDQENGVCFAWGDGFKSLPKGYYEGDIYVNGECLHTRAFYTFRDVKPSWQTALQ